MTDYQLSAIPLFIFMAAMLERAGLIEELFDVVYKLLGGLRGGLASATIISSTILAAMVGVIGAAAGPLPFGIAFDLVGSYTDVLLSLAVLPLAAAVLVLFLREPAALRQAAED